MDEPTNQAKAISPQHSIGKVPESYIYHRDGTPEFYLTQAKEAEEHKKIKDAENNYWSAIKESKNRTPDKTYQYLIKLYQFYLNHQSEFKDKHIRIARETINEYDADKNLNDTHWDDFIHIFCLRFFPKETWPKMHDQFFNRSSDKLKATLRTYLHAIVDKFNEDNINYDSFFEIIKLKDILEEYNAEERDVILSELTNHLFDKGEHENALGYFEKITDKNQLKDAVIDGCWFYDAIRLIPTASNSNDYEEIIKKLRNISDTSEHFKKAQWFLHKLYYHKNLYDNSLECLKKVSEELGIDNEFIELVHNIPYAYQLSSKNNFLTQLKSARALVNGNYAIHNLRSGNNHVSYAGDALKNLRLLQNNEPNNQNIADLIQKAIHLHLQDSGTCNKIDDGYVIEQYSDLSNILESIKKKYNESHKDHNITWLYRGHSNATWELQATIDRYPSLSMSTLTKNFILKASQFINGLQLKDDKDDPATVAEMQHYGIATYYLDWSSILDTALYFALSVGDNLSKTPVTQACLWVAVVPNKKIKLLTEYTPTDKKNDELTFIVPQISNDRMRQQGSFFSVLKKVDEEKCHKNESNKIEVKDRNHNSPENKIDGIKFHKIYIKDDFEGRINKKIKQEMHQRGFKPTFIYPDMIGLKLEIMEHSVEYCK